MPPGVTTSTSPPSTAVVTGTRALRVDVAAFALEHRVRPQLHPQIQVAARRRAAAAPAFARHAHARAFGDAGGNAHFDGARMPVVTERQPLLRCRAWRPRDRARTGARRPGPSRCARGRGRAARARRRLLAAHAAEKRREEIRERARRRRRPPNISAISSSVIVRKPPPPRPPNGDPPPYGLPAPRRRVLVHAPVGAELVVLLALRRIAQHLVGFVHLLELRLGRLVARIHVRVVLAGQLPERLLDFLVGGGLRDPERGVVILESTLSRYADIGAQLILGQAGRSTGQSAADLKAIAAA